MRHLSFPGSTEVDRILMAKCAPTIKKQSDLGRQGSRHGVEEYAEIKYLYLAGIDAPHP